MRGSRALGFLLALGVAGEVRAAPLDLYEWMAVAPIVVDGRVRADDGRYVEITVTAPIRGGPAAGALLKVDLKRVNRDREDGQHALKLEAGRDYLLLLSRLPDRMAGADPVYEVVRGVEGAREVPLEGAPALLDAAERLARIQDRKDENGSWHALREMLEETNPILLENSLDLHLKFERGDLELLPVLRPLLDHPRPDVRVRVATLVGQIVRRRRVPEIPDGEGLLGELYGRARADPAVPVRVAATAAFGGVVGRGPEEVLKEISRSDPDQAVRYEAERILYERRLDAAPGGTPPSAR